MQICLDGRMNTEKSVVVLGMFDGVHIGHRILLKKARALATQMQAPMVVQTFAEHPLRLISPEQCPPLLTTLEERIRLIEAEGADIFYAPPFTAAMRDMPAEDFVGYLVRQWKPRAVVVGYNYSFGAGGAGTPVLLRELGRALGFATCIVPAIRLSGTPVSATLIRERLASGHVGQARVLLGRPYARSVRLFASERFHCVLQWLDDGKMNVPPQRYRCILKSDCQSLPALAQVKVDGTIACALPGVKQSENGMTLQLITEQP